MEERTKLIAVGRPHARPRHPVNPPVERASTILFPTYDDYLQGKKDIAYGRLGTSTHRALEEAIASIEGAAETRLAPSGHQANAAALLAFVKAGDHILMTDGAYDPTRKFAEGFLSRFGVETEFFDPMIGAEIADRITPRTKVVFLESPSSLTFEVPDLPAIAKAAGEAGATVIVDNTWSAGLFYKPLALGAHVSVQSGTKYLAGHSDCLVGAISSIDEDTAKKAFRSLLHIGSNVSADDSYLTLRGIRTLSVRLAAHQDTGLKLAKWLAKRPETARVLHPGIRGCPGHPIWKRDFSGATGLFGVVLKPVPDQQLKAFFNALRLFGMGFSWGGFESLCIHVDPAPYRTATGWTEEGPVLRIHAGLEDIADLTLDLDRAFAAMKRSKGDA